MKRCARWFLAFLLGVLRSGRKGTTVEMTINSTVDSPMVMYVDESIHERLGFIVSAYVYTSSTLDTTIAEALRPLDSSHGVKEFKSGTLMRQSPVMQDVRERLLDLVSG